MLPKEAREISCEVETECTGVSLANHSECQPQEITDGRLGFALNSTLVITVGLTGNLLTLVAIPYVRIRSANIFDPKCVCQPPYMSVNQVLEAVLLVEQQHHHPPPPPRPLRPPLLRRRSSSLRLHLHPRLLQVSLLLVF